MDFSHWDIEDTFRLHVAACLIAGVMPLSQRFPDADEIPAAAKPVLKKLSTGYYFGTMLDESEAVSSPLNPKEKWLFGIAPDPRDVTLVWKHPRGAIRKGVTTPDIDAMILGHLKHAMASREELCRWVKAMGIKSAYDFAPVTEPGAAVGLPDAVRRVKWTHEYRAEVQAYRDEHGPTKTAVKYDVDISLITRETKPKTKKQKAAEWTGLITNRQSKK